MGIEERNMETVHLVYFASLRSKLWPAVVGVQGAESTTVLQDRRLCYKEISRP